MVVACGRSKRVRARLAPTAGRHLSERPPRLRGEHVGLGRPLGSTRRGLLLWLRVCLPSTASGISLFIWETYSDSSDTLVVNIFFVGRTRLHSFSTRIMAAIEYSNRLTTYLSHRVPSFPSPQCQPAVPPAAPIRVPGRMHRRAEPPTVP